MFNRKHFNDSTAWISYAAILLTNKKLCIINYIIVYCFAGKSDDAKNSLSVQRDTKIILQYKL